MTIEGPRERFRAFFPHFEKWDVDTYCAKFSTRFFRGEGGRLYIIVISYYISVT